MAIITGFEKKGPIIYCYTNTDKAYQFDMSRGIAIGLTNKPLKTMRTLEQALNNVLTPNSRFAEVLHYFCNNPNLYGREQYAQAVESLLSYPDLLPIRLDSYLIYTLVQDYSGKLPKGYISWVRTHNMSLTIGSLREFIKWQTISDWPKDLQNTLQLMADGMGFDVLDCIEGDKDFARFLIRVTANSFKRYEIYNLPTYLRRLAQLWHRCPELRPYFDDTKSAKVAYETVDAAKNIERNKKILRQEAKLAPLHGTTVDNLMIFVPTKMEDFTDEGNQQHNCVGHFYHDSIADGCDLIYFLRHGENPDKSYMTCRYNIDRRKTVEHRLFNNGYIAYGSILEKVDRMINKILRAEG